MNDTTAQAPLETSDYLAALRRRWAVIIAVPLLASLLVVAVTLMRPTEYRSTVNVAGTAFLGGEGSPFNGSGADKTFNDTFVAVAESDGLAERVAKATGVDAADIEKGLNATPVRTAPVINVTYRTDRKADAAKVARAAAEETLRTVLKVEVAEDLARQAQEAVTKSQAEIDAFTERTGLTAFDASQETRIEQISALEQQQIQATARRDAAAANTLRAAVEAKKRELRDRAVDFRTYDVLAANQTAAVERLASARKMLDAANASVAAGRSSSVIQAGDTRAVPRVDEAVRKGAAAVGAGAILGGALVVLLELATRRGYLPDRGPVTFSKSSRGDRGRRRAVPRRV